jgi:hypothetical protein
MEVSRWARREWMGKPCRVVFKPNWPVPIGNYIYDGFDDRGLWVTHAENGQRHILWSDIDRVELT